MKKDVKVLAYYLPQFHEVQENSEWWGKGFTEWVSVKGANSMYEGHEQPRVPYRDNYYDLANEKVMKWQSDLSIKFGLDGFVFYHYWFHGKKILEKPVENYLKRNDLKQGFCFSWANESWVRTWSNVKGNAWCPVIDKTIDKNGKEVLLQQDYGDEHTWKEHFLYLLPFFKDKRYICCDGKPIFLIHKPDEIPMLNKRLRYWNQLAIEHGLKGIYIIATNCSKKTLELPNVNAMVMCEPGYTMKSEVDGEYIKKHTESNGLKKYNYKDFWNKILLRKTSKNIYQGGFIDYDDTPRRGNMGVCFEEVSVRRFGRYLKMLILKSRLRGSEFIILNAWNEWGEGAYLEPDKKNGYGYLKMLRWAKGKYKKKND